MGGEYPETAATASSIVATIAMKAIVAIAITLADGRCMIWVRGLVEKNCIP